MTGVMVGNAQAVLDLTESGDTTASVPSFRVFYAAHHSELTRALAFGLGDPELGADAASEAFIKACQRWATVGTLDRPAGWVYRVGLNWGRSVLRRRRREKAKTALLARDDISEDTWPDIDLARALADLSDDHRDVVVARFFLDWTVEHTAAALDIAPGTVKSRLSRALDQLHTRLTIPTETPEG
ncbi:MAG: sigma-70 family RNA polymerase sigma factor [Actinomycetia bacterium]|nr:sigma-70 family RNA polymerase sigma factor [Actinomycetes bacterium]